MKSGPFASAVTPEFRGTAYLIEAAAAEQK